MGMDGMIWYVKLYDSIWYVIIWYDMTFGVHDAWHPPSFPHGLMNDIKSKIWTMKLRKCNSIVNESLFYSVDLLPTGLKQQWPMVCVLWTRSLIWIFRRQLFSHRVACSRRYHHGIAIASLIVRDSWFINLQCLRNEKKSHFRTHASLLARTLNGSGSSVATPFTRAHASLRQACGKPTCWKSTCSIINHHFLISGCDGDGWYSAPSMRGSQGSLWDSIFERILCWIFVHELLEAKQRFQEECDSYAKGTGSRRGRPQRCILIAFWGA